MTTVGYGDISPMTDAGRVIALLVMAVGIGFGSILIGAAAERFVQQDVAAAADESEDVEEQMLRELRALSARMGSLEAAMARREE
jgi:voltage-gated potassium channel